MINAAVLIGEPLNFKDICKIYPPKVKDVVANPNFSAYLKILTLSEEDIPSSEDLRLTPLEFLLNCSYYDKNFSKTIEEAFEFFTHEKITFFYQEKSILFGEMKTVLEQAQHQGKIRSIKNNEFLDFQNKIRASMGLPELKAAPPIDPNEDPRIRRMKEKIRERDRAKAKRAAEGKTSGGITLSTSLAAICCMGIGLTPLNIGELSYASISPIMNMMQEKEKYDIDIRSLLAGASSKKVKPKYWIREQE